MKQLKTTEEGKVMFCPNCKEPLVNNRNLAQGVKECITCKGRYFILCTTNP